jgi:hypothetical protein
VKKSVLKIVIGINILVFGYSKGESEHHQHDQEGRMGVSIGALNGLSPDEEVRIPRSKLKQLLCDTYRTGDVKKALCDHIALHLFMLRTMLYPFKEPKGDYHERCCNVFADYFKMRFGLAQAVLGQEFNQDEILGRLYSSEKSNLLLFAIVFRESNFDSKKATEEFRQLVTFMDKKLQEEIDYERSDGWVRRGVQSDSEAFEEIKRKHDFLYGYRQQKAEKGSK